MDQNNAKSVSTNTQSLPDSACPNKSKEWNQQIFLTSPNGSTFLGITPDLKPNKKYKYSASHIYWAIQKGESLDIKRKPSFRWVMPDGKLPATTFWLKYSSKFDIKLILDKPFNKWEDLLDAKITTGGVKEDDKISMQSDISIILCEILNPLIFKYLIFLIAFFISILCFCP